MGRRFTATWFAVALVIAAVAAPGAFAAQPAIERVSFDDTFADEDLTEACGFPVTTRAQGHVTIRTFDREGTGPSVVLTINAALTATANGKTYRFRDVGADLLRRSPDGSEIEMVIGQIPFGFTGVLKINTTTGEVIHEPRHNIEGRVEDACAALSA